MVKQNKWKTVTFTIGGALIGWFAAWLLLYLDLTATAATYWVLPIAMAVYGRAIAIHGWQTVAFWNNEC